MFVFSVAPRGRVVNCVPRRRPAPFQIEGQSFLAEGLVFTVAWGKRLVRTHILSEFSARIEGFCECDEASRLDDPVPQLGSELPDFE